ncbi:hypothetical protein BDV29DRAFT_180767 [Aspergillus leporis]|uniref:Uncharacterized protein n=1 Tax=Aspergillus leporis TaxID=41062 RepID=A0A5N5WPV1_9EURO|nr:hypothetical protein BDV29DRAFT_180767 [Aspergillus leporis]
MRVATYRWLLVLLRRVVTALLLGWVAALRRTILTGRGTAVRLRGSSGRRTVSWLIITHGDEDLLNDK